MEIAWCVHKVKTMRVDLETGHNERAQRLCAYAAARVSA
ncbi:hypothetical protein ACS15_4301 [Ralstonia insidiosa]|uniref:Uncharacterized protein n=1 Tax=Ralstonia insidiosa TaxID=190721 RepID=A0AAC9BLH3_9RALS|nr:hypothetical protein ACS15_4301 [Ralstonia insidiosa]